MADRIEDIPEVPILPSFTERMKEKIRKQNEIIREKNRLRHEKVEYDELTTSLLKQYIEDFQKLFPNILTNEEIWNRLTANIKHNIEICEIDKMEYGRIAGGYFDTKEHKIYINKKYIDSLHNKELVKAAIFHELTHALVESNPYDGKIHEPYEEGNFITESIVTIMEEDYIKKILGIQMKRVNDYIPTYAREMRVIFGEELIREYIQNFKYLENLFSKCASEEDILSGSDELISKIDSVYYHLKEHGEKVNIPYYNKNIELGIAIFLDNYLENANLSDHEKLKKIVDLAILQLDPDMKLFGLMMKKHIKDKSLIESNEIARLIYNQVFELSIRETYDKSRDYINIVHKIRHSKVEEKFGINKASKKDEFQILPEYDEEKCSIYFGHPKLYDALYELLEKGQLKEEDLNILDFKKNRELTKEEVLTVKDQIAHGLSDAEVRLRNLLQWKSYFYRCQTKDKTYYILVDTNEELLEEKNIWDVIALYKQNMDEETDSDIKESYQQMINHLMKLEEQGIHSLFANDYRYIYEKNGKTFFGCQKHYIEDDGRERGTYEEYEVPLESSNILKPESLEDKKQI